jgi:hypothetical protein
MVGRRHKHVCERAYTVNTRVNMLLTQRSSPLIASRTAKAIYFAASLPVDSGSTYSVYACQEECYSRQSGLASYLFHCWFLVNPRVPLSRHLRHYSIRTSRNPPRPRVARSPCNRQMRQRSPWRKRQLPRGRRISPPSPPQFPAKCWRCHVMQQSCSRPDFVLFASDGPPGRYEGRYSRATLAPTPSTKNRTVNVVGALGCSIDGAGAVVGGGRHCFVRAV